MLIPFKKLIFSLFYNVSLFLILIIGIQNSSTKRKVNFFINETVSLPIGFIVGMSFIRGSLLGGILKANFDPNKD